MGIKLDELRKRLLQQSGPDGTPDDVSLADASDTQGGRPSEAPTPRPTPQLIIVSKGSEQVSDTRTVGPGPTKLAEAPVARILSQPEVAAPRAEITRRSDETEAVVTEQPERTERPVAPAGTGMQSSKEMEDAVAKVFEQTKAFQQRFADLTRSFDQVERMASSAARAFAPLRAFYQQLQQLAQSFEPMRSFQTQLAQMAESFEPMKALREQMSQLGDSFQEHLGELVQSLEPAKHFRERLDQLAIAFDQASELQEGFSELQTAFTVTAGQGGTQAVAR